MTMTADEAVIALGMIADYWPTFGLDETQIDRWSRVIVLSGAEFDMACQTIARIAAHQSRPPTLADLCTAIRPRPSLLTPAPHPDPGGSTKGRAWAAHVSALARQGAARRDTHDHHHGWELCPVCGPKAGEHHNHDGDDGISGCPACPPRRCGNPACFCAA